MGRCAQFPCHGIFNVSLHLSPQQCRLRLKLPRCHAPVGRPYSVPCAMALQNTECGRIATAHPVPSASHRTSYSPFIHRLSAEALATQGETVYGGIGTGGGGFHGVSLGIDGGTATRVLTPMGSGTNDGGLPQAHHSSSSPPVRRWSLVRDLCDDALQRFYGRCTRLSHRRRPVRREFR